MTPSYRIVIEQLGTSGWMVEVYRVAGDSITEIYCANCRSIISCGRAADDAIAQDRAASGTPA